MVHVEEGQVMSLGQEEEDTEIAEGSIDLRIVSTQIKWLCIIETLGPGKKIKASKLAINLITLTTCGLHDIGEIVHDVTSESLQEFMMKHHTLLGALRKHLQELQVQPSQEGSLFTDVKMGTSTS